MGVEYWLQTDAPEVQSRCILSRVKLQWRVTHKYFSHILLPPAATPCTQRLRNVRGRKCETTSTKQEDKIRLEGGS